MPELRNLTTPFSSSEEANVWLKKLLGYAWFKRRVEAASVNQWIRLPDYIIRDRASYYCTAAVTHPGIVADLFARDRMEACHILAHFLQSEDSAFHGADFARTFLDLVEHVFDADTKREAKKIMMSHGIKTRVVSQQTRDRQSLNWQTRKAAVRIREIIEQVGSLGTDD